MMVTAQTPNDAKEMRSTQLTSLHHVPWQTDVDERGKLRFAGARAGGHDGALHPGVGEIGLGSTFHTECIITSMSHLDITTPTGASRNCRPSTHRIPHWGSPETVALSHCQLEAQALAERPGRTAFPVMPGRPELAAQPGSQMCRSVPKGAEGPRADRFPGLRAARGNLPLPSRKKTHPLLQRFAQKEPQLAEAESGAPWWRVAHGNVLKPKGAF